MTYAYFAALVCARCRRGETVDQFTPTYFFHGNPLIKCDASPIYADMEDIIWPKMY